MILRGVQKTAAVIDQWTFTVSCSKTCQYTPVHFVVAVGNFGLCMRWLMSCMQQLCACCALRTCHYVCASLWLPSFPLSCTGYNFLRTRQGEQEYRNCIMDMSLHKTQLTKYLFTVSYSSSLPLFLKLQKSNLGNLVMRVMISIPIPFIWLFYQLGWERQLNCLIFVVVPKLKFSPQILTARIHF